MRLKVIPLLVLSLLLSLVLTAYASTEEEEVIDPSKGFFLGLTVPSITLKGELDGQSELWHFQKVYYIPRIDPEYGLGLAFGFRHERGLWYGAYVQSFHKAFIQGVETEAVFHCLDLNSRAFLFKKLPVHPYYLLGFSFPWLTVKKGARMDVTVNTATYTGVGLNTGAGLVVKLSPNVFLTGGVIYRLVAFLYAWGEGKGRDISDLRIEYGGAQKDKFLGTSGLSLEFSLGIKL